MPEVKSLLQPAASEPGPCRMPALAPHANLTIRRALGQARFIAWHPICSSATLRLRNFALSLGAGSRGGGANDRRQVRAGWARRRGPSPGRSPDLLARKVETGAWRRCQEPRARQRRKVRIQRSDAVPSCPPGYPSDVRPIRRIMNCKPAAALTVWEAQPRYCARTGAAALAGAAAEAISLGVER